MIPAYIPLLKAMKSEFLAVKEIGATDARRTLPLFEVPRIGENILKAKRFEDSPALITAYLNEVTERISAVWGGRTAMVDTYQWAAPATIESGEHVVPYIYSRLQDLGVRVIPVIGYDRWDNESYRLAMQALPSPHKGRYCLRLDSHAIADAAEPDFFQENVFGILDDLNLEPSNCSLLIDFADVSNISVEEMVSQCSNIIDQLMNHGFKYYIVAGCSLPKTIDVAVKKPDSTGTVVRKEMLLWQAMRQEYPAVKIVCGDYGVRGPNSNEGIRNPHTNGKIRYTIDRQFFVVRGHSMQLPGKGEQMYRLAQIIIDSSHYMGESFSWGDAQIAACSREEIKGGAAKWITIDTSHHLAYVVAEVEEFERSIVIAASKTSKAY